MTKANCIRCGTGIIKDNNHRLYCSACRRERDLERRRADGKRWRDTHKQEHLERHRRYRAVHGEKAGEYQKQRGIKERAIVLAHYGGHCSCCHEATMEFLSIDHINGGGTEHRKQIKGSIYRWLVSNKFPEGYQILCHNCNMAKAFYGRCPHENRV